MPIIHMGNPRTQVAYVVYDADAANSTDAADAFKIRNRLGARTGIIQNNNIRIIVLVDFRNLRQGICDISVIIITDDDNRDIHNT
jgi:hypothetical protein